MIPSLTSLVVRSNAVDRSEFLTAPGWEGRCFNCDKDCDDEESTLRSGECKTLCEQTQTDITKIISQHGFTVQTTMCGEEGQVCLVASNENSQHQLSVKVMIVQNADVHKYRCLIWKAAAQAGVGPDVELEKCELVGIDGDKQLYSFVYMERLDKLPEHIDSLQGVATLIEKTAKSGLVHTDSHWGNVMKRGQNEWLFVDWEAGVEFTGNTAEQQAAMRLMWSMLWYSDKSGHGKELKEKTLEHGQPWTTIDVDKNRGYLVLEAARRVLNAYQKSPFITYLELQKVMRQAVVKMAALEHSISTILEATMKFPKKRIDW